MGTIAQQARRDAAITPCTARPIASSVDLIPGRRPTATVTDAVSSARPTSFSCRGRAGPLARETPPPGRVRPGPQAFPQIVGRHQPRRHEHADDRASPRPTASPPTSADRAPPQASTMTITSHHLRPARPAQDALDPTRMRLGLAHLLASRRPSLFFAVFASRAGPPAIESPTRRPALHCPPASAASRAHSFAQLRASPGSDGPHSRRRSPPTTPARCLTRTLVPRVARPPQAPQHRFGPNVAPLH